MTHAHSALGGADEKGCSSTRRLIVVEHPEATHHVEGHVGGWFDSELTEQERERAGAVAERLRALVSAGEPAEVWSSDLRRAAETAEMVAGRLQVRPVLLPGLREVSYGVAEGRPEALLHARFVPPPAVGDRMDHDVGIEGAETCRQVATRVYAATEQALASPCRKQVVVTHGFALTFVVSAFVGMPLGAAGRIGVRSTSGGTTGLEKDGRFHDRTIVSVDDVSHRRPWPGPPRG